MLEAQLAAFLQALRERRYGPSVTKRHTQALREFLIYLDGRVGRPEDISDEQWSGFLDARNRITRAIYGRAMSAPYWRQHQETLQLFLRFLADRGVRTQITLPAKKNIRDVPGYEDVVADYERSLLQHRGLRPESVKRNVREAVLFCLSLIENRVPALSQLTPDLMLDYIRGEARRLGYASVGRSTSALRVFLRFLHTSGRCPKPLDQYLLSFRKFHLGRVPPQIPPEDLYRLFEDVKGDDPLSARDRAVLLLLTLYGLRSCEIAHLTLDDVNWKEGTLAVQRRKAGRPFMLPLHPAVTRALYRYVAQARSRDAPFRELFLTRNTPRPHPTGCSVTNGIKRRLMRLGLKWWPHAMRHSLATCLLNNDCPPEWIQILLGHVKFSSTQIYAKADRTHLAEVADNGAADL